MRFAKQLLIGAIACALPQNTWSQITDVICDDRARLENRLQNVVGAEREGRGMRGPDALIEIWIDRRNGDWTLVQSYPNGTSCIVAIGENWETLTPNVDPA